MPKSKPRLTVARVLEIIDNSVDEWIRQQKSETSIREHVHRYLNQQLATLCLTAIGAKQDSFNRIELDTRAPGYKVVKDKVEETAIGWFEANKDKFAPALAKSDLTGLHRYYREAYDKQLRIQLDALAKQRAQEHASLILEGVGLSTDGLRDALADLIKEEEKKDAIVEATKGKSFDHGSRLKEATVLGVVSYDGVGLSDLIQEPDATCWHVVQLRSTMNVDCHILTNGEEWHPIDPCFAGGADLDIGRTRVLEAFTSARQLMFNYMDETDRLVICEAIRRYYTPEEDDIPF